MLIRPEFDINVTATKLGAAVKFPKNNSMIADFRSRFPRARWGAGTKSWHIPGKLAVRRASLWAAEQKGILAKMECDARDAEWDGLPPTPKEAGRKAISEMAPYRVIALSIVDDTIRLRTAYNPQIVALCRSLGGQWTGQAWMLPLAAGVEIAAKREDIRAWHNLTANARLIKK